MTGRGVVLAAALAAMLCGPGGAWAQKAGGGSAALPPEIPLFPLPNVTLFPGVSEPFLIFEPRYREMVADALKGDRVIGMILLKPGFEADYDGRPPIYDIGCAGRIVDSELLPDGRYTIVLRGLVRFRVAAEDQRRPYRMARVEALPEPAIGTGRAELEALRGQLEFLLASAIPPGAEVRSLDDDAFVNAIAQRLGAEPADRQRLLEADGVLARAKAMVALLEAVALR